VSQRHAIVTPLLRKTELISADMSNFRPDSNLSFMSKVVERAVVSQLMVYLYAFYLVYSQHTERSMEAFD